MERSELPVTPPIQAEANNIPKGSIDCGIKALGCCNGPGCQKLGSIRTFLIVFSISGILQGAVDSYFRISAQQAALDYSINHATLDWLLVANYILQSTVAILVTYWAGKFHQMAWLGCLVMLQAIGCFLVIVPTLSHNATEYSNMEPQAVSLVCQSKQLNRLTNSYPYAPDTIVLMFILQLGTSLGSAAFYTLGLSYLDNNSELVDSPALIGTALAAKFWGPQLGSAISLAVNATPFTWWLGWTIIAPALFIVGLLLSLFPRRLMKTVIKMAASRIMEVNNFGQPTKFLDDIDLWPSLRRLLTNKILIINIVAVMFVQAATMNYLRNEQSYLQSRFFLPSNEATGLINEWTSRFLSHLLKPPTVALCVLVAGLIIAKVNPSARSLTAWNIAIGAITCALYVSYVFLRCPEVKIAGTQGHKIMQPYCANACTCPPNLQFSPVCPQNSTQTYFSPCHAGCSSETVLNDITLYQNCTCAVDSDFPLQGILATEGACNYRSCQKMWIIYQIMTIFSTALLSTGIVGRIIISLRSVIPQDKALALAIELTITGFFTYVPAKIGYDMISVFTCQFTAADNSKCYLHSSPLHGNLLNIISASLIALAVILDIILWIYVKKMQCYRDSDEDSFRSLPLRAISSNSRYDEMPNEDADQPDAVLLPTNNLSIIRSIQNSQDNYGTALNKPDDHNQDLQQAANSENDSLHLQMQNLNNNRDSSSSSLNHTNPSNNLLKHNNITSSPQTDF